MGRRTDAGTKTEVRDLSEARISRWATRINEELRQTVESIIGVGRALTEAKAELEHGEWGELFERQLIPFSSQTANKLMSIARNPALSNPAHVRDLPVSWGTLYELTKLPEAALERAIEERRITPEMERKDVKRLREEIGEVSRGKPEPPDPEADAYVPLHDPNEWDDAMESLKVNATLKRIANAWPPDSRVVLATLLRNFARMVENWRD